MFLPTADSPGVVPGIVGAVVVAVAGAISSFIAYQKKKLCFKENGKVFAIASFLLCLTNWNLCFLKTKTKQKSGWHETRARLLIVQEIAVNLEVTNHPCRFGFSVCEMGRCSSAHQGPFVRICKAVCQSLDGLVEEMLGLRNICSSLLTITATSSSFGQERWLGARHIVFSTQGN